MVRRKSPAGLSRNSLSAVEEPHREPLLEIADGFAKRRWRNAEMLGGAREIALLGHRHEGAQLAEFGTPHQTILGAGTSRGDCSDFPTGAFGRQPIIVAAGARNLQLIR
jgi:hypothetical protein